LSNTLIVQWLDWVINPFRCSMYKLRYFIILFLIPSTSNVMDLATPSPSSSWAGNIPALCRRSVARIRGDHRSSICDEDVPEIRLKR
jgi:hypothetical protein